MEIRVGHFILKSDQYSYWVEEEYIGKDAKGKEKKQTRRVAGYASTIGILVRQFTEHKHKAIGADTMTKLIRELKQIAEDTASVNEAALKSDFKRMSKLKKEVKDVNEKGASK